MSSSRPVPAWRHKEEALVGELLAAGKRAKTSTPGSNPSTMYCGPGGDPIQWNGAPVLQSDELNYLLMLYERNEQVIDQVLLELPGHVDPRLASTSPPPSIAPASSSASSSRFSGNNTTSTSSSTSTGTSTSTNTSTSTGGSSISGSSSTSMVASGGDDFASAHPLTVHLNGHHGIQIACMGVYARSTAFLNGAPVYRKIYSKGANFDPGTVNTTDPASGGSGGSGSGAQFPALSSGPMAARGGTSSSTLTVPELPAPSSGATASFFSASTSAAAVVAGAAETVLHSPSTNASASLEASPLQLALTSSSSSANLQRILYRSSLNGAWGVTDSSEKCVNNDAFLLSSACPVPDGVGYDGWYYFRGDAWVAEPNIRLQACTISTALTINQVASRR